MEDLLIRYIHFLAIILFASGLIVALFLLSERVSPSRMRLIARADALSGVSVIVVIITGLLLWWVVGKPSSFYSSSVIFYMKLTVLFFMFLLTIKPTRFFLRNRNSTDALIQVPRHIILLLRVEVALLALIPLLAVLMANGAGL